MKKFKLRGLLILALAWIVFYYATIVAAAVGTSGVLSLCLWLVLVGIVITTLTTWRRVLGKRVKR